MALAIVFLIFAFFSFFLFSPYSFIAWKTYLTGMISEKGIITGKTMVHWNYQFLNTKPYLFQLKNLLWQMGPVLPFTSLLGLIFYSFRLIKFKNKKLIPIIVWALVYFITIGSLFVKYVRYFNLLLPFFCLFSSLLMIAIYKKDKVVGKLLIGLALASALFYSLAFFSIYLKEQTRITASKWIFANIPEESKFLKEDEHLPIVLKDYPLKNYKTLAHYPLFTPDNEKKLNYYVESLFQADYIILSTRRTHGVLSKLKKEFPLTSFYYQQLFNNRLGYQKIAEFSSYPKIFGIEINDDKAEETFQVFDHPKPMIFKNVERKSEDELKRILEKSLIN